MNWRDEAKELGIKLFQRKKEDVLKDIEATKNVCKDLKIIIGVKEATEICRKALFEHISDRMVNITCEKWFLNCKRKGIVFKGQKNDDTELTKTQTGSSQGSGAVEHVPAGGQE